jgi:uncharacterized RDD family membrane protein YckC
VSDNPSGWYPDPAEPTTQRYWDGDGWVGDRLPVDATPPEGPLHSTPTVDPVGSGAGDGATVTDVPPGSYPYGAYSPGAYSPGAYPPGAYPPGAYPPDAYPPGTYPPGAYPPGAYPPGGFPQGTYPQGTYPQGTYPQGTYPPGVYPPGSFPPGVYPPGTPPGAYPPGAVPPGTVPPGSVSPGSVSPGSVSPGAVSPGTYPPASYPPGVTPPGAYPPGVMPPGAYPPGAYPPAAYQPAAYQPGAYQPGAMPPGAYQPGAMPPGAYQPGAMPPGAYPPGVVPPGGYPPGSTPTPTDPKIGNGTADPASGEANLTQTGAPGTGPTTFPPGFPMPGMPGQGMPGQGMPGQGMPMPGMPYPYGSYGVVPTVRVHGFEIAPLGRRFIARLIDFFAVLILNAVLNGYLIYRFASQAGPYMRAVEHASAAGDSPPASGNLPTLSLVIVFFAMIIWAVYEVPPTGHSGQTLGKRLLHLRVLPLEGDHPLGGRRALRRWMPMGLPMMAWSFGVGFLIQLADSISPTLNQPLHLAWHDKYAATVVVALPPADLSGVSTPANGGIS